MKRIIALLLCLLLIVLPLTACSNTPDDDPDDTSTAARPNLTLKFAIVVDERTTKEGIQAMSDKFNEYTMQKYSTAVDFYCYTADEYVAAMEAIMNGIKTDKPAQDVLDRVNQNASVPVREEYPDARVDQFDLVVITDEEMYQNFANKGYITSLNSYLSSTYKVITTMIHKDVMDTAVIPVLDGDGNVMSTNYYGVPACKPIGEYNYLAINKKALDYYNFNESEITDFSFAYKFWNTIVSDSTGLAYWQDQYSAGSFSPILNSKENFLYPNVQYLSQDGNESLVGVLYNPSSNFSSWNGVNVLTPMNLLTDAKYTSFLKLRYQATAADAFGTGAEKDFLMGIVSGQYSLRNSNPDYVYCPLNLPSLDKSNVFSGILAVSSYSVNVGRSVELIQGLMTDSNLMNLLLYGVDTNYLEDSDGIVSFRVSSNYALDYDYAVGNLIALAKPCADYGQSVDYYAGARLQNLQNSPLLFNEDLDTYLAKVNVENWEMLDAAAAEYLDELEACADYDAFLDKIEEINNELTKTADTPDDDIAALLYYMTSTDNLDIDGTFSKNFFDYLQYRVNH